MNNTTFTVTGFHGFYVGTNMTAIVPETRWYMLLWYSIIRKKNQTRLQYYTVTSIDSGTTFTVK